MDRYAGSLDADRRVRASADAVVSPVMPDAEEGDFHLTALERGLLGEALRLLADTRARALQLTVEFSRRHGVAAPDVHDFQLPTIVDLQRRLCVQEAPLAE